MYAIRSYYAQVLLHGEVLVEAEALGHVADALLDALGVLADVVADDRPLAAAGIRNNFV